MLTKLDEALPIAHICQICDVGPGHLVLEYVEGTPLRGPLAADEAVHRLRYGFRTTRGLCDVLFQAAC